MSETNHFSFDCSDSEKEKNLEAMNCLFKKIKGVNLSLLAKSNLNELHEIATLNEAMDFYISSFALSFLNNIYLSVTSSLGQLMNMRCILEGIAVYSLISKIEDQEVISLFRQQPFILEGMIYKKYPDLDGKLFFSEQIKANFEETKAAYKTQLHLNSDAFSNLSRDSVPFLNGHTSFEEVVKNELGERAYFWYKNLSMLIHPHDYSFVANNQHILHSGTNYIGILLQEHFFNIPVPNILGLEEEYLFSVGDNWIGYEVRGYSFEQKKRIEKMAGAMACSGLVNLSVMVKEFSLLLFDFSFDLLFGYVEHGTTKWKTLVELLATISMAVEEKDLRGEAKLVKLHTQMMFEKSNGQSCQNTLEEAYFEYKKRFPNGVEKCSFDNAFFDTLGFLMNEKGETPSLKSIAYSFIEKYSPKINGNQLTIEDLTIPLDQYAKMKYDESQNMAHASGYMFFSTTAAWSDGLLITLLMDDFFQEVLSSFLEKYRSEDGREKIVVNGVRNYINGIRESVENKKKLLLISRVKKPM